MRGEDGMMKDDSGQFILLMSIILAIGLVILLVLLNQSLMAGHSSSESIMSFPKNDIRDLKDGTVIEAQNLATGLNNNDTINGSVRKASFNVAFDTYNGQMKQAYLQKGALVGITVNNVSINNSTISYEQSINSTNVSLFYTNGETTYNEVTTIYT